jgi:sulfur carrier protein ThiS
MTALLIYRTKTIEVEPGISISSALKKIDVPGEAVLAIVDGALVSEDRTIQDGEVIQLVSVISGG